MYRIIIKVYQLCSLFYWTFIANIKLRSVGSVGRRFRAEGPVYLTAISGEIQIGDNVRFGPYIRLGVTTGAILKVGSNVSINQGSVIVCYERIEIGDYTRVGEYVSIRDYDHGWKDIDKLIVEQGFVVAPCTIGEDVWIGRSSSILKGVAIMDKAVVGANSVVTKNVGLGMVVVGVPAIVQSKRVKLD